MKKVLAYLAGFFSALLAMAAGVFIANSTANPTTEISGKVKAKKGGVANLSISSREIRKQKRKLKKQKK